MIASADPVLGLKIDIDTYAGLQEGVPRLLSLLERRSARATFYVPAGPDRSGRAVLRVVRQRGFLKKMLRTGGLSLYGLETALRGTLLPGVPMTRGRATLRAIVDAGHELGVHGWDHVAWHDRIDRAGYPEVYRTLRLARETLASVTGVSPETFGAPGWHCTPTTLQVVDAQGFRWASDTRGVGPFRPRCGDTRYAVPQLPTTLPTLDEVAGRGDTCDDMVARYRDWAAERPWNVITCHSELEGRTWAPFLEGFLDAMLAEGVRLAPLGELAGALPDDLPEGEIVRGTLPGRGGLVTLQR